MSILTGRQEKFCHGIADGMTQADAYRNAYSTGKMQQKTIHEKASALMADGKIAARVQELKDALSEIALWTRAQSVEVLSGIATNRTGEVKPSEQVSAVKELNAMHGYNAPAKVDLMSSDGSMSPPRRVEINFVSPKSESTGET